jgi:hypothetical protein
VGAPNDDDYWTTSSSPSPSSSWRFCERSNRCQFPKHCFDGRQSVTQYSASFNQLWLFEFHFGFDFDQRTSVATNYFRSAHCRHQSVGRLSWRPVHHRPSRRPHPARKGQPGRRDSPFLFVSIRCAGSPLIAVMRREQQRDSEQTTGTQFAFSRLRSRGR